jgi:hypothetical protein
MDFPEGFARESLGVITHRYYAQDFHCRLTRALFGKSFPVHRAADKAAKRDEFCNKMVTLTPYARPNLNQTARLSSALEGKL